jgi:hypothetical protein
MNTMTTDTTLSGGLDARILREGYGESAWHGPELKGALADVTSATAFWRPAPGRHNIAEIALHHAYCVRGVRAKLDGVDPEPFVLEGDDWFTLADQSALSWSNVVEVLRVEQTRLATAVAEIQAGRMRSPLPDSERFDLVLGITCHAVYHAGQVQLIKRLAIAG